MNKLQQKLQQLRDTKNEAKIIEKELIDMVIAAACEAVGIFPPELIYANTRKEEAVFARYFVMWWYFFNVENHYTNAAALFGLDARTGLRAIKLMQTKYYMSGKVRAWFDNFKNLTK